MNGQEMIVLVVLIVIIGRVISAKYGVNAWGKRSRRDRDLIAMPHDVVSLEDGARMKSEIDRLNARIQVLERLATDPSKRLSDQIDALGAPQNRDR
jgi:hypothetical protein